MSEATLEAVSGAAGVESGRGTLPLLVGVTGHRDLRAEDVERLEGEVEKVFDRIKRQMPRTSIIIVSALAEGADRLVARVGLRRGYRMVSPLPMPPETYKGTFETDEARDELDDLLKRADPWFALSEGRVDDPDEDRETCYALTGAYLAQSCQVLIALWDGQDTGKPGGSSAVVNNALKGVPDDLDNLLNGDGASRAGDLDEPDGCAVVYHIHTPRASGKPPPDPIPDTRILCPEGALPDEQVLQRFLRIAKNLDQFNVALEKLGDRRAVERGDGGAGLLPAAEEEELPPNLSRLREQFARSNTLATEFQNRTDRAQGRLLVFTWIAIGFFALYSSVAGIPPRWSVALLLIFLAYLIRILFAGRSADGPSLSWLPRRLQSNPQREFLDYRALAEALRVQFYWSLVDVPDRVEDHYLRQHRTELDWIRVTLRVARLLRDNFRIVLPDASAPTARARFDQVSTNWVEGQGGYFEDKVRKFSQREADTRLLVWRLLCLATVAILVLLSWLVWYKEELGEWFRGLLILAAALAPAGAGLLKYRDGQQAISEQKKRYERMAALYRIALPRLGNQLEKDRTDEARGLLREIGREALAENANWVLLRRDRPVSVP